MLCMVRFGVVGTNWITDRLLTGALLVEGFELTAVYSRTMVQAQAFGDKYGVTRFYTNLEQMAMSTEIDAVYIASPNSLHAEQAIVFLQHGKHVLCEKPLAANANEVAKMIETAKQHGVLLMEAMKSTHMPNFKVIQDYLHKLGPIRKYAASYCQYSSRYDKYKEGIVLNAFKPEFANGALMDLGVYCLYPLITLFGRPERVAATSRLLSSGIDGQGSVIMEYESMEATVSYSKISNSYLPTEIQGEAGSMIIDKIHTPEQVRIHYNDGTIEELSVPQTLPELAYEMQDFISLIEQGELESRVNTYQRSLDTMLVMEEVRRQVGLVFPNDR